MLFFKTFCSQENPEKNYILKYIKIKKTVYFNVNNVSQYYCFPVFLIKYV